MFPRGTYIVILLLSVAVSAYGQTPTPVPEYYLLQLHAQDVFLHKEIDSALWSKAVLDENRAAGHPRGSIQSVKEFTQKQIDDAIANPMLLKSGVPYYGILEGDPTNYHYLAIPRASFNVAWIQKNYFNVIESATYEHRFRLNIDSIYDQALNDYWKGLPYGSKGNIPVILKFSGDDVKNKVLPNVEALDQTKIKFLAINDVSLHGSAGTFTIGTSGADYTTWQAWEDAQQSVLTTAYCRGIAITEGNLGGITISGWDTTINAPVWMDCLTAVEHNGSLLDNTDARTTSTVFVNESFVWIWNQHIQAGGASGSFAFLAGSASGLTDVRGNLIDSIGTYHGLSMETATTVFAANNIIYSGTGGTYAKIENAASVSAYFYWNTFIDRGTASAVRLASASAAYDFNNILVGDNAVTGTYTLSDTVNDYNFGAENASDNIYGTNGGFNQTFTFTDATTNHTLTGSDTHLDSGTAIDALMHPAGIVWPVTTDIFGVARSAPHAIGANDPEGGGAPTNTPTNTSTN